MEEDEENDVELKRTMWLIIRKKKGVNEVLKDFFPDYQQQVIRVRDIIKFGRVNFKISALYSDKIDPMYTGSCYKPPKINNQDSDVLSDDYRNRDDNDRSLLHNYSHSPLAMDNKITSEDPYNLAGVSRMSN